MNSDLCRESHLFLPGGSKIISFAEDSRVFASPDRILVPPLRVIVVQNMEHTKPASELHNRA